MVNEKEFLSEIDDSERRIANDMDLSAKELKNLSTSEEKMLIALNELVKQAHITNRILLSINNNGRK